VVYSNDIVAKVSQKIAETESYDGCSEVSYVKWFGDVGRGKINHDCRRVSALAEGGSFGENLSGDI
jgi:hypothetical protein